MKSIFITRKIPDIAKEMLEDKGYDVFVSPKDGVLTKDELISYLKEKPYDAVLSLLTDQIDKEVFQSVSTAKIFANYAVGFNRESS